MRAERLVELGVNESAARTIEAFEVYDRLHSNFTVERARWRCWRVRDCFGRYLTSAHSERVAWQQARRIQVEWDQIGIA